MLALGVVGIGCELHIEGSARCDYPQVLVENDQRFTNGVDHCLRKGTSVFNLTELLFEHCRPLQSVRESEMAPYIVRESQIDGSTASTHLRSSAARVYLKVSNIDQRPAIRAGLNCRKSASRVVRNPGDFCQDLLALCLRSWLSAGQFAKCPNYFSGAVRFRQ